MELITLSISYVEEESTDIAAVTVFQKNFCKANELQYLIYES